MHMFVRQGIKAVRMDDIAQELGISKRTLYEMFGDKEQLLYLCLKHYLADINESAISKAKETSGNMLETILTVFFEMTRYNETNNRLFTNLRKFYPSVYNRIHCEQGEAGTKRFKKAIEECVNSGLLDNKTDIDLALTMLYYIATGIVARKDVILPEGVSAHEAFISIVLIFFRGLSTSEGLRIIDDFAASERFKDFID